MANNVETFMRAGKKEIPVYLFTGFLDSGKTTFIQGTLEDPNFQAGEKTLVLLCEEGEEELNPAKFGAGSVEIVIVEEEDELTESYLAGLESKFDVDRVIVEFNGMWTLDSFYGAMPPNWVVYQEMCLVDSQTFLTYNANMRNLVYDKLKSVGTVVFKKFTRDMDKMEYHKIVRAVSRQAEIIYEYGENDIEFDNIEDPLPFDVEAPVIEIEDRDYALWYRDITEEPKKYDKKTVRFKGQVAKLRREKNGMFAPGRFVMTCCADDITFMGIPCKWAGAEKLKPRSWVTVTAKVTVQYHSLYRGVGPILTASEIRDADEAAEEVCTF